MSFQFLPGLGVLIGGLALAAGLFLLARLRVRHREHVVATTLFWKQALDESRARQLVQRFRHPWAYALTVLVAGLLWLALAGPQRTPDASVERIVVVDGAALDDARRARLVAELPRIVAGFARGTVRVVFTGEIPALLHDGHAAPPLIAERMQAVPHGLAPRTLEAALVALGRQRADARPLDVLVVAPTPVRAATLALLDENVRVTALDLDGFTTDGNRGVTVLGLSEAASGRFDTVDVRIEERGPVGEDPVIAFDDARLVLERVERDTNPERRVGVLRDVPATGHTLRVLLTPDAFPADDSAAIRLPRRTPVRVELAYADASLRAVLERDPGVELVATEAEVRIVGPVSAPAADDVPTLAFVAPAAATYAFELAFLAGDDAERVLLEAWERLGLAEIDATGLAEETDSTIDIGARAAARRGVDVRADLLSPSYNFVAGRAFPLFVAGAVRWLAGVEPLVHEVRAGWPLVGAPLAWIDDEGRALEAVGGDFVPRTAGRFAAGAEQVAWVSLLDPELTRAGRGAAKSLGEPVPAPSERGALDLVGVIALLAFALLGLEWWLHQRGRMP